MRAFALVASLVVGACGSNGNSTSDAGGDGKKTVDAPPPATPLDQRLTVSTVSAPGGVKPGDSAWRIWGLGSLNVAPIITELRTKLTGSGGIATSEICWMCW